MLASLYNQTSLLESRLKSVQQQQQQSSSTGALSPTLHAAITNIINAQVLQFVNCTVSALLIIIIVGTEFVQMITLSMIIWLLVSTSWFILHQRCAPCGLRGCKNGPARFPGRMSYKATKLGLVSVLYLLYVFYCVGVY